MTFKRFLLYMIIFIIIYYIILQLSYKKTEHAYKYFDMNNDSLTSYRFESQVGYKLPIIIWNNDINININNILPMIMPAFTIKKTIIHNFYNNDLISYHTSERLFIIAKKTVKIELYPPNMSKRLKYVGAVTHKHIYNYKIENEKPSNLEIEMEPNDILYVPRYWLFNMSNKHADIIICSTLFSFLTTLQI